VKQADCQPNFNGLVYVNRANCANWCDSCGFARCQKVCEYVRVSLDTHIRTHTRTSAPLPH
jgi:hypothetical protein